MKIKGISVNLHKPERPNGIILVYCQGFPGRDKYGEFAKSFTDKGYTFLHPHYFGSWDSEGGFSISNCKETIKLILDELPKEIEDLSFNKIILIGHSFGGSIVLAVGAESKVDGIVSLAPIINFKKHNDEGKEEDLSETYNYVKEHYPGNFRDLNEEDWNVLLKTGADINPTDFFDQLRTKSILLVHGTSDSSIDYKKTKKFYEELSKYNGETGYLEFEGADHSSIRDVSPEKIMSWLKDRTCNSSKR